MSHVSVRFFFCIPGKEETPGPIPAENLIGEVDMDNPSDDEIKDAARRLIAVDTSLFDKTTTHNVVADVGISKISGGLGASHPYDTILLFSASQALT